MSLAWLDAWPVWRGLVRRGWSLQALLLAAGLMLVPMAGYLLHGRGVSAEIAQAEARREQLQVQWHERSVEAQMRELLETEVRQLQTGLDRSRRELFDDDGLASLLQSLARLGEGLSFEQVTVLESRARPHYLELPVQLQVSGDYPALQLFISRFARLGRLVTLQELLLTRPAEHATGPLNMQLQLQAYRAVVPEATAQPATTAPLAPRDPFAADEASDVAAVPSGMAAMVGHLRDRRGQVALIRVGEVLYPLREGDLLGRERVTAIDEERVELVASNGDRPLPRVLRLGAGVDGQEKEVR